MQSFSYIVFIIILGLSNSLSIHKLNGTSNETLLGGCVSTKFGCCNNSNTQCLTENCSNCFKNETVIKF